MSLRRYAQQALGGLLVLPLAALAWLLVKAWQWATPQVHAFIERALE